MGQFRTGAAIAAALWACSSPFATASEPFHYDQLEDLIRTEKPDSIDALLPLLPESLRNRYTLVYSSGSLQQPDVYPAFPRIIFYSEDGKLLLALTKGPALGPAQAGPDSLETIAFDDSQSQFVFRQLKLAPGVNPLDPPPAKNPPLCLGCHTPASPRPNWEPYNFWPGVYGSVSRLYCNTMQSGTPEWDGFQSFLRDGSGKGRYAYLGKGTPQGPKRGCPDGSKGELTFANGATTDPNGQLSDLLGALNMKRIGAILRASPSFPKFRYLLAALGKSCDPGGVYFYEYFGPGYARKHAVREYGKVQEDVETRERSIHKARLEAFSRTNAPSALEPLRRPLNFLDPADDDGFSDWQYDVPIMVAIQAIAERMQLDTKEWSMSFISPASATVFGQGSYYPGDFFKQFVDDPSLAAMDCDALKAASVAALKE